MKWTILIGRCCSAKRRCEREAGIVQQNAWPSIRECWLLIQGQAAIITVCASVGNCVMGDDQASVNNSEPPQETADQIQILWAARQLEQELRCELSMGWELPPVPPEARQNLSAWFRHRMRAMARLRRVRAMLGLDNACTPCFTMWVAALERRQLAVQEARGAATEEADRS